MSSFRQQFVSRFEEFLQTKQLLTPESHVLLAVSGGVDSMTMLHLFAELQERWKLTLGVAHVNHRLRGEESNGDEAFVRTSAETLHLPFHATRVNTFDFAHREGIGKQEAARELRYQFFEQTRQRTGADVIATAHNANDNAETVLMNALRGSGVHGLAGIPLRREQNSVIRPILFAYREEIERYAQECGINFRQDSSNTSLEYTRNLMRLNVIPFLETSLDANIAHSLNRISRIMREVATKLSAEVGLLLPRLVLEDQTGTLVNIPLLLSQSLMMQEEIVLSLFRKLHIEPQAEKILNVLELCSGQTGRSLSLSESVTVYRDRDRLHFAPSGPTQPFEFPVEVGKSYRFRDFEFVSEPANALPQEFHQTKSSEFIDSGRLGKKLVLRSWREGDWFIPFGLHGKKKLSDFFVDTKIPLLEKKRIPVLESDGEIVWVCGHRLDERFMVTPRTVSAVKLQYLHRTNVHHS